MPLGSLRVPGREDEHKKVGGLWPRCRRARVHRDAGDGRRRRPRCVSRRGDRQEPARARAGRLRRDRGSRPQDQHGRGRRHALADRRAQGRRREGRRRPGSQHRGPLARREPASQLKLAADPTAGASDASYRVWRKYDAVAGRRPASSTRSSTTACVAEHPNLVRKRVVGQTAEGRDIIALQVTKDPTGARHRRQAGGALQRDAARPRVARRRDLQAHAQLLRRQLRQDDERRPRGHAARRQQRAVVRLRQQPGRLRVHVHVRQPAVAQEPARQQQQRDDRAGRRRRPQPQLLGQLGP